MGMNLFSRCVDRFLSWPLPVTVRADDCATVQGAPNRTGTNLLTANEAEQMFRYALDADAIQQIADCEQHIAALESKLATTRAAINRAVSELRAAREACPREWDTDLLHIEEELRQAGGNDG